MENQSLSKNLIYQRKLQGLSQEKLADLSGVTVRTIQRIERGEVNAHMNTLKLLADALQIDIRELLPLENPRHEALQTKWLLLFHSVPLLGALLPLTNILVPIFLWIHKRDDNPLYDRHGRAVINFQLTITLLLLIGLSGFFVFPLLGEATGIFFSVMALYFGALILNVLFIVLNIFLVLRSGRMWYPLAIPFLRKRKSLAAGA
ncbi:helix-turn-helix domain-containing protein [Cesiribacter andamanensis]|uniref:Anaerobic benzoate catabolism transcriptional regulator n=1 Tax=Cesiribacter andamanensis AMV16 TaxID=1279009 RepID=M7NGW9_9BACT|nr:helix-turn-helix domain-containing protein [Cesiribacter andamanensis]EMR01085.1 anaerobic benzoate catabolism transcriptional regulator [Cesiribacter andamanensis AMV16]